VTAGGQIRVLIVDDHQIVAEGIALALRRHGDIEIVGIETSVTGAVQASQDLAPGVVLMDYHLADGTGADAAAAIREARPDTAVVMISGDSGEGAMLAAVEAGASGYLSKTDGSEQLAQQVRRAAAGEMLIPAAMLQRLVALSRSHAVAAATRGRASDILTPREREILELMARGLDNPAIAEELTISYHTVRGHVQSILEKLDARTKLEAVARAHAEGLLPQ
jgi:DNA-binding NarL/FixJ family response regulator